MYTCLWLKSEYIMVPLNNLDAQKFKKLAILSTQFLNPGKDPVCQENIQAWRG